MAPLSYQRRAAIAVGIGLTLTGFLLIASGGVAAQEANGTAVEKNLTERNITVEVSTSGAESVVGAQNATSGCNERIDETLRLCGATYRDGTAIVELYSTKADRLTLTDAAAFMSGGEIFRDSTTVYEGRNIVRVPATQNKGFSGVSVDTGSTLYAVPITNVTQQSRPPISYGNVQGLVGITALGAGGLTFYSVKMRREDEDKDVERIL